MATASPVLGAGMFNKTCSHCTTLANTKALTPISPFLGAGMFNETCRYYATFPPTDVPLYLLYKCYRAGNKSSACAQLDLRNCIISIDGSLKPKLLDGFDSGSQPYPGSCVDCLFDEEKSSITCQCPGRHDNEEETSTIYLSQWLENSDGKIVGVENLNMDCRSETIPC